MNVLKLDSSNAVFKKEGYLDVPATVFNYADGVPGIEICLELSEEEIKKIKKTHRIYIYMVGDTVQPFYPTVTRDIEEVKDGEA